jgi:hypothetical protein
MPRKVEWADVRAAFWHSLVLIFKYLFHLKHNPPPVTNPDLKTVLSEELQEIVRQRFERLRVESTVETTERTLTGLAFSGGGIRSATFNLGILQALRELDLLRHFDYLSTVSGGGYIGAWLTSNALRQEFWLRREADWRGSIGFLRRYSNYHSPKLGFLSADSWSMLTNWSRNAILLQTFFVFAIAFVLLIPHLLWHVFHTIAEDLTGAGVVAAVTGYVLLAVATRDAKENVWNERLQRGQMPTLGQGETQTSIVIPYLASAQIAAAVMWGSIRNGPLNKVNDYSEFLTSAAGSWWFSLLFAFGCLSFLSFGSIGRITRLRRSAAVLAPVGALGIFYLGLCAIAWLFAKWRDPAYGVWLAFAIGPTLVLLAFSLSIIFLIAFLGRSSSDLQRDWWSRLGAWFCIYGAAAVAVSVFAIFAPYPLVEHSWVSDIKWPAILAWLGTTAGGLLAGNSGSTKGGAETSDQNPPSTKPNKALELLAAVGPYVFIAGLFAAISIAIFGIFDSFDPPVSSASYWPHLERMSWLLAAVALLICAAVIGLLGYRLDINIFSLNVFYRDRLTRCYLGASRKQRNPGNFTGFDPKDDVPLADLSVKPMCPSDIYPRPYAGPFPIVNCALNLGGSSDLSLHTRQSANFTFTPLHVGAGQRSNVGYARLREGDLSYCGPDHNPTLGQAISISGAAANPNMGFHTSLAVSFLLTVFNARLGGWFPNPAMCPFKRPGPLFSGFPLLQELLGMAGETGSFLNLSDGGHFENLGIYELVRRRCRVIVAGDGECDPAMTFGSLGNVIRLCQVDFGATIKIDVNSIRRGSNGFSQAHCAVGTILYDDGSEGLLIYLKSSLTGDEDTAIREYRDAHPTFPHETTADQFFAEDQFECYRMLGRSICLRTFRDCHTDTGSADLIKYAEQLPEIWTPSLTDHGAFTDMGSALQKVWANLRGQSSVLPLLEQLQNPLAANGQPLTPELYSACQEILQLMENTYISLSLDDTWNHPDNAGWRELFRQFGRAPLLAKTWAQSRDSYGRRFQNFCRRRLDLP